MGDFRVESEDASMSDQEAQPRGGADASGRGLHRYWRRIQGLFRPSGGTCLPAPEHSLQGEVLVRDGRIICANERAAELTGYPVDLLVDMMSEEVLSHFYPGDRAKVEDDWDTALANPGTPCHTEWRLVTAEGELRWFHVSVVAANGAPNPVMQVCFVDITGRKQAQADLQQRERQFRLLAENAHDVIYRLRLLPALQFDYVSPSIADLTGYTPDECYADPNILFTIVHPDERERLQRRLAGEGLGERAIIRWMHREGAVLWAEMQSTPIRDEEGRLVAIEGIARDVTERVRAETALRQEHERAQSYLEVVEVTLLVLDQQGKVALINRKGEEVLAVSTQDAVGTEWVSGFVALDDQARVAALLEQLLAGEVGGAEYSEYAVIDAQGVEHLMAWHNALLRDEDGAVTGVLAAGNDVTERRRLEQSLQQSQKIEAVARLAGGVAHDFNNLLTVINLQAEVMLSEIETGDPLRAQAAQILQAGRDAAKLTQELLAFGRRQLVHVRPSDLNEMLRGMRRVIASLMGERIDLEVDLDKDLPPVTVNPGAMERTILELVEHGRDSMPQGGTLIIKTERILIEDPDFFGGADMPSGAYAMLVISDTGVGMTPEEAAHIFEPFYARRQASSGLGLATVHGTIEQFGGRIDVHSRPGVGTTFRIYLPLATAAAPGDQQADEQGEAPVEGSERILLVEDEVSVRRLAASFLTRLGYDVVQASNGLDALRLLERQSDVDLIISDVVMPEMSGGELVRRLRERGDETPVIYMSGYADDVMARSGVRRQRVEFIRKPFTQHELAQRVRQTLDRALSRAE